MEQLVFFEQARSANGASRGGDPGGRETYLGGQFANLKILCAQALEFVNREMQQVMGGLGYSRGGRGARVEQISRDVRVMVVGGGSEEILTDLSVNQEQRAMAKL
jgi:alkylation response protein AidB-like acyl-CoA dehydrogenase